MRVVNHNTCHLTKRHTLIQHIHNENPRGDEKYTTLGIALHAFQARILVINLQRQSSRGILILKLFPQRLSLLVGSRQQQHEFIGFLLHMQSQQRGQNLC
jgi:hypothetical protein